MTKKNKRQVKTAIRKIKRMTRKQDTYYFWTETADGSIPSEEIAARYLSINGWNVEMCYGTNPDYPNSRSCQCTVCKTKRD